MSAALTCALRPTIWRKLPRAGYFVHDEPVSDAWRRRYGERWIITDPGGPGRAWIPCVLNVYGGVTWISCVTTMNSAWNFSIGSPATSRTAAGTTRSRLIALRGAGPSPRLSWRSTACAGRMGSSPADWWPVHGWNGKLGRGRTGTIRTFCPGCSIQIRCSWAGRPTTPQRNASSRLLLAALQSEVPARSR
jgi:hypothetical protein